MNCSNFLAPSGDNDSFAILAVASAKSALSWLNFSRPRCQAGQATIAHGQDHRKAVEGLPAEENRSGSSPVGTLSALFSRLLEREFEGQLHLARPNRGIEDLPEVLIVY